MSSMFVLPCQPECYFQSERKIEPDLRLRKTKRTKVILQPSPSWEVTWTRSQRTLEEIKSHSVGWYVRGPNCNGGHNCNATPFDLYDTGEALYQLSERANWEQIIELVQFWYIISYIHDFIIHSSFHGIIQTHSTTHILILFWRWLS